MSDEEVMAASYLKYETEIQAKAAKIKAAFIDIEPIRKPKAKAQPSKPTPPKPKDVHRNYDLF